MPHSKPNLGEIFPNFTAQTTEGEIEFHDWIGDSWAMLFSHPADYTPVCTTELRKTAELLPEFKKRGVKLIGLSCNDIESHRGWSEDVMAFSDGEKKLPFPLIDDERRYLATTLGMIDPAERDSKGLPLTARAVFIIGPDKKLKLSLLYPATTGRNYDEILRVIDSLQLTDVKKVATPVNWKKGEECMVVPTLSDEDAEKTFPGYRTEKLPSAKNYMRFTKKY